MPLILIPGSSGAAPTAPMLLKYGSYTFPTGTAPTGIDDKQNLSMQPVARGQGEAQLDPLRLRRTVHLQGGFILGQLGVTNVRASMDTFLAALYAGRQNFQIDGDRYLRLAAPENLIRTFDRRYGAYAFWTVDMVAADPFFYEVTPVSPSVWTNPTGGTFTIPSGGNSSCFPALTFTFASAAAINLTITNSTTGETMTLSGTLAQTGLTVDCLNQTIVYSGGGDATLLWDGVFPSLAYGNNTFSVTANGAQAAVLNSISIAPQSRWL